MVERTKKPCPPPFVRDATGCCVRPGAPFGGPASGLWPLGGAVGPSSAILPASCTLPSIMSECFKGCDAPGNCGFVTVVGSVTFTGESVVLDPGAGAAVIERPLAVQPAPNTTLQVRFREIAGPPQPTMAYGIGTLNAAGEGNVAFQLRGDGSAFVQVAGLTYNGTWSPNGGSHTVVVTVSADGTPSLFIDQVYIPLVLGGTLVPAPFGPAFAIAVLNFGGTPQGPAIVFSAFVTKGVFPPTTVFCCPDGQAP